MAEKRMLSGIQPTGDIHLGNYLGAIKNWVALLDEYFGFFFIVDYHALTVPYEPKEMQARILAAATEYLACGLDPARCIIYVQSHVPVHTELTWIFNTVTPIGELERMTQYKDKSQQHSESLNVGLLDYPVLQAADILLYHPDIVPVGKDQEQHLELTRIIARKYNNRFGDYFREPDTYLGTNKAVKIVGLDGEKKMSKSVGNHIPLRATAEETEKLVLRAVTDTNRKRKSDPGDPYICNVYTWHELFSKEEDVKEICEACRKAEIGCVDCKRRVAKSMNAHFAGIRTRITELDGKQDYVADVLNEGAKRANEVANETMAEVRKMVGLHSPWGAR